jgi:hypothetical protein
MKTLSFPNGSIGEYVYQEPTAARTRAIAIPSGFSGNKAPDSLDADERWVQVGAALVIAGAVLLAGWLVA